LLYKYAQCVTTAAEGCVTDEAKVEVRSMKLGVSTKYEVRSTLDED
jgi:hypothetical protein